MGYRSTFITQDYELELPEWFTEKYAHYRFNEEKDEYNYSLPMSSNWERKFYDGAQDPVWLDLAKVIREDTSQWKPSVIAVAVLHEDGQVDRVLIEAYRVRLQRLTHTGETVNHQFISGGDQEYEIPKENS